MKKGTTPHLLPGARNEKVKTKRSLCELEVRKILKMNYGGKFEILK